MNCTSIENEISNAYICNNREKINTIYIDLLNSRSKLDRWFNRFLDMFDEKMNSSSRHDKVWKLYHNKSQEYSNVTRVIKNAEYYLRRS